MAAIARTLSHTFSDTRVEIDFLKAIAILCAAGLAGFLLVATLVATYGLDLSPGFF